MVLSIILVVILAFIVVFSILWSLFKTLIRAVIGAVILAVIIFIILGLFVVKDAGDFRDTFQEQPTTYILEDNGSVLVGFEALRFNFSSMVPLESSVAKKQLDTVSSPGKVFVIERSFLNTSLSNDISETLQEEMFEELITYKDPAIRARIFLLVLSSTVRQKGPFYLARGIRSKEIKIFPRTLLVKTLGFMPKYYFNNVKSAIGADNVSVSQTFNTTKSIWNSTRNLLSESVVDHGEN